MYKVFYNEKALILTEKPLGNVKTLRYNTENQFDEAIDILKNTNISEINIFHHNLEKLWLDFKSNFHYLEAAGGVVLNPENKILFIHRLGKWDLPKGKVEEGETTEIAAVREVEEECGINNLDLKDHITTTYHIYFQNDLKLKATYWYNMNYDGNETLIPQLEEGIGVAEWKGRNDLPQILPQTYGNIKIVLETIGWN
jgi:hypothetical protein